MVWYSRKWKQNRSQVQLFSSTEEVIELHCFLLKCYQSPKYLISCLYRKSCTCRLCQVDVLLIRRHVSPGAVDEVKICKLNCEKTDSSICLCVAGLSGPPSTALHRPEGQTILSYPDHIHELWSSGCHGKRQHTRCGLCLLTQYGLNPWRRTTEPETWLMWKLTASICHLWNC